jgi:hypothetical protein
LERNLSNIIYFVYFFFNFSKMLDYVFIKQVDTPVHNCDIGVPLLYKAWWPRDDHVILRSTSEFLFEFQNRIFLEFFVRVSSCSYIKPFEVRGSTVVSNKMFFKNKLQIKWKAAVVVNLMCYPYICFGESGKSNEIF